MQVRDYLPLKDGIFPSSVAVIGASRKEGKVGHEVMKNIIQSGFPGNIFPVNPHASEIMGKRAFKNIRDIPDEVDVAVIAVPSSLILSTIRDCGLKKVKLCVVLTAGFRETGPEGAKLERQMLEEARNYGMRILGPNCLGFINTYLPLNLSFSPSFPNRGAIGMISQSGALITSAIDWSLKTGAGFSLMFSIGNGSDVNEIDLLAFLSDHPETKAIALYLESSAKGREFVELLQKITVSKPVFVLRGGISEAGVRAASSHTGSIAGSESAWKAGLARAGAVEVSNLSELFNSSWAGSSLNLRGRRIIILTNAGGAGIITSDLIEKKSAGELEVSEIPPEVAKELKLILPPESSVSNPVDVLGDADSKRFRDVLDIFKKNRVCETIIVVVTPQAMTDIENISSVLAEYTSAFPLTGVFIGGERAETGRKLLASRGIPAFSFPEEAVSAIYYLHRAMREKAKTSFTFKKFRDINYGKMREILKRAGEDSRSHLIEPEALDFINSCGIKIPRKFLVTSVDEAIRASREIGFPVVMKIASPDIIHKTEVGGVVVGIKNEEEIKEAYSLILGRIRKLLPEARISGVVIEEFVKGIAEVIVGMKKDPDFGPIIMFGLGGIYVEILRDVSFKLAPLSEESVEAMFREIKSLPLLKGFRGNPRGDLDALKESLLRFSQMVTDIDNLLEVEINPLVVMEEGKGVVALDARVTFQRR